jgi:hypothetical protein
VTEGELIARDLAFESSTRVEVGLELAGHVTASVVGASVRGPYRRAVRISEGARVTLGGMVFSGPRTAIHATDAELTWDEGLVDEVAVAGAAPGGSLENGPALFVSRTQARISHVAVRGHEYALLARDHAQVRLEDFVSVRAGEAALGVVSGQLEARDLFIADSGPLGAVQSVEAAVTLIEFEIRRAHAYGVSAVGGTLRLEDGTVKGVALDARGGAGEGIHAGRARVSLKDVTLRGAPGGCVVAVEGAEVGVRGGHLEDCGTPAGSGGAGTTRSEDVPALWADCASGARIEARTPEAPPDPGGLPSCVDWPAP